MLRLFNDLDSAIRRLFEASLDDFPSQVYECA